MTDLEQAWAECRRWKSLTYWWQEVAVVLFFVSLLLAAVVVRLLTGSP